MVCHSDVLVAGGGRALRPGGAERAAPAAKGRSHKLGTSGRGPAASWRLARDAEVGSDAHAWTQAFWTGSGGAVAGFAPGQGTAARDSGNPGRHLPDRGGVRAAGCQRATLRSVADAGAASRSGQSGSAAARAAAAGGAGSHGGGVAGAADGRGDRTGRRAGPRGDRPGLAGGAGDGGGAGKKSSPAVLA